MVCGPHLAIGCGSVVLDAERGDKLHDCIHNYEQRGWEPDASEIKKYLVRLINRQWDVEELAEGEVLKTLIKELQRA